MHIVDVGSGAPLVIVPGIQGRWEWMSPAVDALAGHCRVITFSLADEPTAQAPFDPADGLGSYVDQIAAAMDQAGVAAAVICGVSYGGLIAACFAARHPERTLAVVMVSAVPPDWRPDPRASFYLKAPRLMTPVFMLASLRLYREIAAATPGRLAGLAKAARHGRNVLTHMFSPVRMARRAQFQAPADLVSQLGRLKVQALLVTGEARLERVVPPRLTLRYQAIWPDAEISTLAHTGHLGLITRPEEFARVVGSFVQRSTGGQAQRRRIG